MGLFGNNNEQQQSTVQMEVRTNNSWFTQGIPTYILRNSITERDKSHKTIERMANKGQDYVNPLIRVSNYVKIVETEQTIELFSTHGVTIVPKAQIIEIRYV